MKIKTNISKSTAFLLGIGYTIAMTGIGYAFIHSSVAYFTPILTPKVKTVETVKTVEIEKELTDDDVWVANELSKAGLDPVEAFRIIWGESRGNANAYNVNTNGTIDVGMWQINSIHIKSGSITLQCAVDVRCSTKWAIEKRLGDGSWQAWVASRSM